MYTPQVCGYQGAKFKRFNSRAAAEEYLDSSANASTVHLGDVRAFPSRSTSRKRTYEDGPSDEALRANKAAKAPTKAYSSSGTSSANRGAEVSATLYYGGGGRGNPGPMKCVAVLYGSDGEESVEVRLRKPGRCYVPVTDQCRTVLEQGLPVLGPSRDERRGGVHGARHGARHGAP
jgi:hypothetical protein